MGKKRRQMFRKKFAGHPRSQANKTEEIAAQAPAPKPVEVKKPEPKPAETKKTSAKTVSKAENKKPDPKPAAKEVLTPTKKKKK